LIGYRVSERDPKAMRDSFEAFKELASRFPDSRYAADASDTPALPAETRWPHDECGSPTTTYRRGAYIAALERAQGALREFPGAAAQQEALTLIAQSYERLGLTELQAGRRARAAAELPAARRRQDPLKNPQAPPDRASARTRQAFQYRLAIDC